MQRTRDDGLPELAPSTARTDGLPDRFLDAEGILQFGAEQEEGETMLLLAGEGSFDELPELLAALQERSISCFGAVFPEVILGTRKSLTGYVVARVTCASPPLLIGDIDSRGPGSVAELSAHGPESAETVIVLADADCQNVAQLLSRLHNQFGSACKYMGAGAGSHSSERIPCVFTTEDGLKGDAMVLGFPAGPSSVAARHGWVRAAGPVVATDASGNTIRELNWRPAFDVYRELVRETSGQEIEADYLSEIGIGFPFGMLKEGSEDLVRLPVEVTAEGGLVVIGGVPSNSVLHILHGTNRDLLDAVADGARDCLERIEGRAQTALLLDCITRSEFLAEDFVAELRAVETGLQAAVTSNPIGALTRGEIASTGSGYPEWLNKTAVVGVFG